MPLLGKIVVIKRNGADGTEFPLTASCLFGRKLDCDIRIQLPQVSKEHCRIELNENKELILTNLSSVNPTSLNGGILQQSERLKHGDLITVIDRSFRFEYPPAPTPKKKRLSTPGKGDSVKVLRDQQVRSTPGTTEKKKSEHATDTCLKDGSNLPGSLDQSVGDQQNKSSMDTMSPFSDLYNMVKRDLTNKLKVKSASLSNTPLSRPSIDIQELEKGSSENDKPVTVRSAHKRRSSTANSVEEAQTENLPGQVKTVTPVVQGEQKRCSEGIGTPVSQKKTSPVTPQKFTADQVAKQIAVGSLSTKSPENRAAFQNSPEPTGVEGVKVKQATRTSPRTSAGKRSREVVATPTSDNKGNGQSSGKKHRCEDLSLPAAKRKRVSFGGQLSPELFDKRLPPNSPLRRGASPRRCSLGLFQKPYSLLRRASTIGLMGYQLNEDIIESPAKTTSPKRAASPAKTPSPARTPKTPSPARTPKTPSPAKPPKAPSPARTPKAPSSSRTPKTTCATKKSPNLKAKTPSPPKNSKTPPPSSNLSAPKSSRRLSNASTKSSSLNEGSLLQTPTVHGRFSVSQIGTPSPIHDQEKEAKEEESIVVVVEKSRGFVTPKATARRISMKASTRKTPKSMLKSALEVVRSRRSGASRANLKVVSSWADIVKFGQAKPQMEVGVKKTATKRTAVKRTRVTKPKTPARISKNHTSTGHADSPANIVVGKAYLRSAQLVGAAPKVVCNVALFKKDMKMDEDFTGVADIFKTPANSRRKSGFTKKVECQATTLGGGEITDVSVINTPQESGEMVVSPLSVVSTAELGHYSSEAVTRFLQDEELDYSTALSPSEVSTVLHMHSEDQTVSKKTVPVQTPQHKPAPSDCLTGVKRLMRTPKQKAEPIEDLRGKLLKTPKEPKLPQEDSLDGIKELLTTPKHTGNNLEEDMAGLKRLMKTPIDTNSPGVCAVSLRRLVITPKDKTEQEETLIGVKQLFKTPRQKKQPVEEDLSGIQQMMKTPELKNQPVEEDLTQDEQMMKTPKPKKQTVEEDLTGIQATMESPKQKKQAAEEDLTGVQQMMITPKQKKQAAEEDLTGVEQMMKTPKQKRPPVEDLVGVKRLLQTPKEKGQPVDDDLGIDHLMKTPKGKPDEAVVGSTIVAELHSVVSGVMPMRVATEKSLEKESIFQDMMDNSEDADAKISCQDVEEVANVNETVEAPPSVTSPEQKQPSNGSSPPKKTRGGTRVRKAPKSHEHQVDSDSVPVPVAGSEEEHSSGSVKSVSYVRGRRGKSAMELVKDVPVPSPARKSTRGRIPKEQNFSRANAENDQPAPKLRRGRKVQHVEVLQVGPFADSKASVEVEASVKSPAPVRTKRGRKEKHAPENPQETEAASEASVEVEVALESADLQPSIETEAHAKSSTRARRGRPRKESSEPTPIVVKSDVKSSDIVVEPKSAQQTEVQSAVEPEDRVKPGPKSRRGRAAKKEPPVTAQVEETSKATSASVVLPEEHTQIPMVKSRRGRRVNPEVENKCNAEPHMNEPEASAVRSSRSARNKQVSLQMEDIVNETVTTIARAEEPTEEPVVRGVRGGRRTKQPKSQVLEEAEDKSSIDSETIQTPAARSARGKRPAPVKDEPETRGKRGCCRATVEVPRLVVTLSRCRKAIAKSEPEDGTVVVGPVAKISHKTIAPVSVMEETPSAQAASNGVGVIIGVAPKRGRVRIAKKARVSAEDASVNGAEEAAEEETRLASEEKEAPATKDDTETKQSATGRRGRTAKKQAEEAEKEKPAVEAVQPIRRGRAGASGVAQHDEAAACPKNGQKRKNMEVVAEKTESLPKRKRGKAVCVEAEREAAAPIKGRRTIMKEREDTCDVKAEESSKKDEKPIRGRRKASQGDVLPQDSIPEPTSRRGARGQKKAETDVPSAPVRRTRRK